MLAGAPYLNVNALEVSVVAVTSTSTSRDKIGGQAYTPGPTNSKFTPKNGGFPIAESPKFQGAPIFRGFCC